MIKRTDFLLLLAMIAATLGLAACADDHAAQQRDDAPAVTTRTLNQTFSQAGDGTVIPDAKPDAEAVAFARRCSAGGASIALGMSECALIGTKGTPSRVVGGEDQSGHSHDAIWYIEGGVRTVYKFDDDKLIAIVK